MPKVFNRSLKLAGESKKPGATTTVTVLEYDGSDNVLKCSGASVPSSEAGYAVGCELINTSTGHLYINQGSATSCTFNDVGAIAASEIALAEGNILVGNSSAVGVALSAKTDGRILVGNGTTVTSVAVSGNATMTNAGAVTVTGAAGAFTAVGAVTSKSTTAVPATAGAAAAGAPLVLNSNLITIEATTDAPTHTRPKGSLCINLGGSSTSTRLFINTDGGTTWTAFTTAA